MPGEPTAVFVYGTLKRGQKRERCWPRTPVAVRPATILAELYDLGPYPALGAGGDRVLGELWEIAPADLPATLRALDEVEGYGTGKVNLYERRTVECRPLDAPPDAPPVPAHTYFLADPARLQRGVRVKPGPDGCCQWPAGPA